MNANFNMVCPLELCKKRFGSVKPLIRHCKQHIRYGFNICCPFDNCTKMYKVVSSFSSHVSRCHKERCSITRSLSQLTPEVQHNIVDATDPISMEELKQPYDVTRSLVYFYFMLQHKYMVSGSTIEKIISHAQELLDCFSNSLIMKFQKTLNGYEIPDHTISNVLQALNQDVGIKELYFHGPLRSVHSREKYLQQNFTYVPPVAMKLSIEGNLGLDDTSFQYIPILKSIKAIFTDDVALNQFLNPQHPSSNIKDFADGLVFKKNPLFNSEKTIQIILYQDAFEIVNPLGSSKRKHKLLCVYFTLANFYPFQRSKIDSFQLVLLCKDKYVNSKTLDCIFRPLIEDLKSLEIHGIDIGTGFLVRGSILCISGDNLGSHFVGGFTTNFSTV